MELTLIKTEKELTTPVDTMQQILARLSPTLDELAENQPTFECSLCNDSGFVFVKTEYRGKMVDNATRCECRKKKIREKLIAAIPAEFRGATIDALCPMVDLHPKQAEAVRLVKANPNGNFILSGNFGTGKSHLFWTLYRQAVEQGKKTYGGTLRGLIDEYQKAINLSKEGERYFPPITADDYKQSDTKCALFLDDIDKARSTEYVAEQLFELVDAAYSFRHQIVVTTNLRIEELLRHFQKADDFGRFGGAIIRRLLDNATEIEMF